MLKTVLSDVEKPLHSTFGNPTCSKHNDLHVSYAVMKTSLYTIIIRIWNKLILNYDNTTSQHFTVGYKRVKLQPD